MTNIEFIEKLKTLGFNETTKPEYGIESFDEYVTSYEKYNNYLSFSKKWFTVYVVNPHKKNEITNTESEETNEVEANIKCVLIDKNKYPYEESTFFGKVFEVNENYIVMTNRDTHSFGTFNELSTKVTEESVIHVEIPQEN